MSDLPRDVLMLAKVANEIEMGVENSDPSDLGQAVTMWALIAKARTTLSDANEEWARKVATAMTEKVLTVEHVGTVARRRKADRKAWDKERVLPDVLDTMLVDPLTGEVTDPDPLSKVLHVWNLGAPRVTALRERGLDPDEYCTVEYGGWTLQLVADNTPKEETI